MAKRGRPLYPDVLTPREWEVLALLREGLTNEQIAGRLDITERTAKYHVSEILGKLGVATRDEAARWQPAQRPWWAVAAAPLGLLWRKGGAAMSSGASTLALVLSGAVVAAAIAGAAFVAFTLARDDGGSPDAAAVGDGPAIAKLAFAAGGSIYTVNVDGTGLTELIPGDRNTNWNASPAFSPDGSTIAFTRNFNIWVADADGTDARFVVDLDTLVTPPPGPPYQELGVQSLAWSPDGEHIAYVLGRIGASAVQEVWVMRADGSERTLLVVNETTWLLPSWLDNDRIAVAELAERVRVFRVTGEEEASLTLPDPVDSALTAIPARDGAWLVGPFISEGPIRFGTLPALQEVASGVSPALSPEGGWFAYFDGDTLRVASVDGALDEPVMDLAPLGGRDSDFGGCVPETPPGCPYRVPTISWIGPEPAADKLATAPTSVTCAAGSTDRFLELQQEAWFVVYCPSYLPDGFALARATFDNGGLAPTAGSGSVFVEFVRESDGARITFDQGNLGNDLFPDWRLFPPAPPELPVRYGDLSLTLYYDGRAPEGRPRSSVVWGGANGIQRLIMDRDRVLDASTLEAIAAGMAPLDRDQPNAPGLLLWSGDNAGFSIRSSSAGCGDAATAEQYDLPRVLEVRETSFTDPSGGTVYLGLEDQAYDYVPEQVAGHDLTVEGWDLSQRVSLPENPVNRFGTSELFLRRLGRPGLLFR